jgi:hypothetical protein
MTGPRLALDHVQRDALACPLDRVGVSKLMRSNTAAHSGMRR